MPIYKMDGKKDGLQKYRLRINYTDREGKAKQLDRVAYGKDATKELEYKLLHNLNEEPSKKMTLQDLFNEYISAKKYEVRESSLRKIERRLNSFVLPSLKNYRLDKLSTSVLQKWKTSIEEYTAVADSHKLSTATKQSIFSDIRALLNYGVKMEYISKNPLITVGNFKDAYEYTMALLKPKGMSQYKCSSPLKYYLIPYFSMI